MIIEFSIIVIKIAKKMLLIPILGINERTIISIILKIENKVEMINCILFFPIECSIDEKGI